MLRPFFETPDDLKARLDEIIQYLEKKRRRGPPPYPFPPCTTEAQKMRAKEDAQAYYDRFYHPVQNFLNMTRAALAKLNRTGGLE